MNRTVKIGGHEFKVLSDEECDKVDWWICARVQMGEQRPFEFALESFCTKCGSAVWFDSRPKISKPPKICIECAVALIPK